MSPTPYQRTEAMVGFSVPGVRVVDTIPAGWVCLGDARRGMTEKAVLFEIDGFGRWLPKRHVRQLAGKQLWFTTTWALKHSRAFLIEGL